MIRAILLTCVLGGYAGNPFAVTAAPRKLPPASLRGPVPFGIRISPTTGEDMARSLLVVPVDAADTLLRDPVRLTPDADLPLRGIPFTARLGERSLSAIAAQLDQAAIDDGAPCDSLPQFPAWPPTWRVRFYGSDGRVTRDFNVPVRIVRCRALERFDAIGPGGDGELRSAMAALVNLGVEGSPSRLAPEAQRIAFLEGPVETLGLSLVGSNRATLRLSTGAVFASRWRSAGGVHLSSASMRAALTAALKDPSFVAGMERTPSDVLRRQHPHAEVRVLQSLPGPTDPVLRLVSYVSPGEAAEIARKIVAAVKPSEAEAIRANILGTDR